MKRFLYVAVALLLLSSAAVPQRASLPFDEVSYLDGVKFKIRVPGNWNGTLLVYMPGSKSGTPPPEPAQVEVVCPGSGPVPVGRTDKKGGFVVGSPASTNMVDARQGSSTSRAASISSAAPTVIPAGCSVQARLAGYVSTSIARFSLHLKASF